MTLGVPWPIGVPLIARGPGAPAGEPGSMPRKGRKMHSMDDVNGFPVEGPSASEGDHEVQMHDDSQVLLDALTRRARRLGRHLRRTKAAPDRILKLLD